MATTDQRPDGNPQDPQPGRPERSDNLLPAEDDEDGRFDVAEEVNLDQQSDGARRIGQAPEDPVPDVPGAAEGITQKED